jgi:hypothetical protein
VVEEPMGHFFFQTLLWERALLAEKLFSLSAADSAQ